MVSIFLGHPVGSDLAEIERDEHISCHALALALAMTEEAC